MDKQPDALKLADQLRDMSTKFKTPSHERGVCNGAIEKLRRLHAENQGQAERIQDIYKQLNDTEKEVDDLRAELHEEAKINGAGAERELRLMAELDEAKRINLRDAAELRRLHESLKEQREAYNLYTTVSIEMRTKDEALLRQALEAFESIYVDYGSARGRELEVSFDEELCNEAIEAIKERLK